MRPWASRARPKALHRTRCISRKNRPSSTPTTSPSTSLPCITLHCPCRSQRYNFNLLISLLQRSLLQRSYSPTVPGLCKHRDARPGRASCPRCRQRCPPSWPRGWGGSCSRSFPESRCWSANRSCSESRRYQAACGPGARSGTGRTGQDRFYSNGRTEPGWCSSSIRRSLAGGFASCAIPRPRAGAEHFCVRDATE